MRKHILLFVFLINIFAFVSCKRGNIFHSNLFSDNQSTIIYQDGFQKTTIQYSGNISINDDDTAIRSISPGGFISFEKGNIDCVIKSDEKGLISYFLDGKKVKFTVEEKAILAQVVSELAAVGIDAVGKCERTYEKSGVDGVLALAGKLKNDQTKITYLSFLLNKKELSTKEVSAIITSGKSLSNDYDKANFYKSIPGHQMQNKDVSSTLLQAVLLIESDYDKAEVLKHFLKIKDQDAISSEFIAVVNTIEGSYERKTILETCLQLKGINNNDIITLLPAITSIESSYEKSELLKEIYSRADLNESLIALSLDIISTIDTDYEKSIILQTLCRKNLTYTDKVFIDIIKITTTVESDYEKTNVVQALVKGHVVGDPQWLALLELAASIESSYDKEVTLTAIAQIMPHSEAIKSNFIKVAKTLEDDAIYGKLMRGLEN